MKKLYIIFLCSIIFTISSFLPTIAKDKLRTEPLLDENSPTLQAGRGFLAELRGDYKSAIKFFSKAIVLNPSDTISYHQRGLCYYYENDFKNALKDFDKTIDLDPNYTDAYGNRSLAKMQLGDYEGAIKDIEEVLKVAPNDQKSIKQKELILNKMQNK